eukprot:767503-Hanusia_phi.AAC.5
MTRNVKLFMIIIGNLFSPTSSFRGFQLSANRIRCCQSVSFVPPRSQCRQTQTGAVRCSLPLHFPHGMQAHTAGHDAQWLQSASSLDDNTVHLWMVDTQEVLGIGPDHETILRSLLSPEESARYHRSLHTAKAMEQAYSFLLARALLRTTLSRCERRRVFMYCRDIKPEEWNFVMNEHGRPEIDLNALESRKGLKAGTRTNDGSRRILSIAERFFSEAEFQQLKKIHPDRQQLAFSRLWTLKEAYVKARGLGISGGEKEENQEDVHEGGGSGGGGGSHSDDHTLQVLKVCNMSGRQNRSVQVCNICAMLPYLPWSAERTSLAHTVSLAVGGQEPFELVCLKTIPCHESPDVVLDPRST